MTFDILCFSHLRWNFVYQRPQHLISRFGKKHRVIFFEEPEYGDYADHYVQAQETGTNVVVVTPRLFHERTSIPNPTRIRLILDQVMEDLSVIKYIAWYYTPMSLQFSDHLKPILSIYDCMDELSAFRNAPVELIDLEKELFERADLIFTGGHSLYEHKKTKHHSIFPFPSSIDKEHFSGSRNISNDPPDQLNIPRPRLGFYGVIDERFDLDLLDKVSELRPEWHFVLIGPLAKIDPSDLPVKNNIHYLGQKAYKDLPAYLAGWDIAIMPFAVNESTKFISPTKTPEYLAGGKPVISTPIRDVVIPYGEQGMVHIVDSAESFVEEAEKIFSGEATGPEWQHRVDDYLSTLSWDRTWGEMYELTKQALIKKIFLNPEKHEAYV